LALVTPGSPSGRVLRHLTAMQILFAGVESLVPVALVAFLVGAGVITWLQHVLSSIGALEHLGTLLVAVVVREVAPMVTIVVFIARSASAISVEVGYMKLQEEIAALEVMRLRPVAYLWVPRIVGGGISGGCLAVLFTFIALASGYAVASAFLGTDMMMLTEQALGAIMPGDVILVLAKSVGICAAVAAVACSVGLSVRTSMTEIPRVTGLALVISLFLALVANGLLSLSFYMLQVG